MKADQLSKLEMKTLWLHSPGLEREHWNSRQGKKEELTTFLQRGNYENKAAL